MDRPVGSKYLLEETLGRGASGTVWRARVRDTDEVVAVKVLREELAGDPDVVTRFLRERSLLLRLSHPNLVRVRDLVVEGELLALVMDLIDGPDLRTYLRDNGPLPPAAAALTMAQVCDALAVTHADGVIHRDLKPANIMLNRNGDSLYPMLTDFGIARLAESPALTRTHELVGTPSYVAPETAEGRPLSPSVDIYAAGVVLYELFAGRPPFTDSNPIALLHRHLSEVPVRPEGMPDAYWLVTERCLAKQPELRPDARGLGAALRTAAEILQGTRPDDGTLARLLAASAAAAGAAAGLAAAGGQDDPTRVVPRAAPDGGGFAPAPPLGPPPAPPGPDGTRVLDEVAPPYGPGGVGGRRDAGPPQPPGYPQPALYRDEVGLARQGGPAQYAPPPAPYRAPEPPPHSAPPQPPPQREAPRPPEVAPPRRNPRREREPREPREPRRGRGFRLSSIPGLGCTLGCLLRLVIFGAILFAIYWFSPLRDWVNNAVDVFDEVKGWYDKVKDFMGGGGDGGSGGTDTTGGSGQ
ncbi:serine/threonine protein kinase [Yinghuangia sp. ASG 101]|uniref:serine/threonine-protein kinase n=1 Tax=Yinghuangia sp. ASG 101 TaxID=2896848 RepID=UPI001E5FF5FF|nr:serine/threonine-protein kinase [Yinghuangia sp. ASG 101]UGQ09573.1 serine/threonine protein kinase [Yinghuangia sp. ASG 101]